MLYNRRPEGVLAVCQAKFYRKTQIFSPFNHNIFVRRDRLRGTICFFFGMFLVLMRWGLFGMCLEAFGFLNLFGNFLPTALTVARQIPYLSTILDLPVLSQIVDFIAGKTRPKYSV